MSFQQLSENISSLQAEALRFWDLVLRFRETIDKCDAALARSDNGLIGSPFPAYDKRAMSQTPAPQNKTPLNELGRKGTKALLTDNGESFDAIIIEVLSQTRALIRVMDGSLAGEEIEAKFPEGELDYPASLSHIVQRQRPKLVRLDGFPR